MKLITEIREYRSFKSELRMKIIHYDTSAQSWSFPYERTSIILVGFLSRAQSKEFIKIEMGQF